MIKPPDPREAKSKQKKTDAGVKAAQPDVSRPPREEPSSKSAEADKSKPEESKGLSSKVTSMRVRILS